MNEAIGQMITRYAPKSKEDYENALKEILQEIILLGLYRGGFFEKAAFYGGTAMRILHGLDRFSEDLDFTLLKPESKFNLNKYFPILARELKAYGFDVELSRIEKNADRVTESAFVKANTQILFLNIDGAKSFANKVQKGQLLKIKFEVDVDPATSFETEIKTILLPSPFTVRSLDLSSLFGGKMHAALFRKWKLRVKGRDFYDVQWYLARQIPINLRYLEEKIKASKAITQFSNQPSPNEGQNQSQNQDHNEELTREFLIKLFKERVKTIDWTKAKQDIYPFIKDRRQINLWSADFFSEIIERLVISG